MGGEDMKTKHAFIAAYASEHVIRFMCLNISFKASAWA